MAALLTVLALFALFVAVVYHRGSRRTPNWRERGESRGRTAPANGGGSVHRAKSEPEGALHIKVIRKDGTVEDHGTVPAERSE